MKGKVEEYLEYLEKEEKSIATRKQYGRDVMSFLRFAGGARVTKELVIRYKENLQKAYPFIGAYFPDRAFAEQYATCISGACVANQLIVRTMVRLLIIKLFILIL